MKATESKIDFVNDRINMLANLFTCTLQLVGITPFHLMKLI